MLSGMLHSEACQVATAERERERAAFLSRWPNACRTCGGWGVITHTENQSPIGSGYYWPETLADPCDDCTGKGKCPRCGKIIFPDDDRNATKFNAWFESYDPAPCCGWSWGKGDDDTLPESRECYGECVREEAA